MAGNYRTHPRIRGVRRSSRARGALEPMEQLLRAEDVATLLARTAHVAAGLGYTHLAMYCGRPSFVPPANRRFKFRVVHNFDGDLGLHCQSPGFLDRDPVLRHCMDSMLPLAWGPDRYTKAGAETLWSLMASHGLRTGVAAGSPSGSRARLALVLGGSDNHPDPGTLHDQLGVAALIAPYALTALEGLGLFDPDEGPDEVERLSRRETEVLRLASEGLTETEIGELLGISPNTASKQLTSAARRLRCRTRVEAIVRAICLRLL